MSDSASKADAEVKKDDPKQDEKKENKKKRPAASRETVDADIPLVREPRQRKQTEFFKAEVPSEDRPVVIEKGAGTPLGEIENVKRRLDSTKLKENHLKILHRIMFPGTQPREGTVKKNIAQFSGFPAKLSEKDREKFEERLEGNEVKTLKNIADLLDIEVSGKKNELATRILDFLHKPVSSGKAFRAKSKSKSSSSSSGSKSKSKSSSKKEGTSRGPSAYILFTQDYRQKIKDKHPDATFAELGKLLGEKWGSLSEAEKNKYKEKAGGSAQPAKKKQKSSKPAAKKKTAKRAHSDDEEEESEEEEEEEKKPAKKKQKAPAKKEKAESSKSSKEEKADDKPAVRATEEQKTQMQAKVRELLKGQDLYKYTMGLLKKDLAKDFPADVISGEKDWLRNLLKEEITKQAAEKKSE